MELYRTDRLIVRKLDVDSTDVINKEIVESFDLLHEWVPWAMEVPSPEKTKADLTNLSAKFDKGSGVICQIFDKNSRFMGMCHLGPGCAAHPRTCSTMTSSDELRPLVNEHLFEVGYWLGKRFNGKGYMREAIVGLLDYGREYLGARTFAAVVCVKNVRSSTLLRTLGFESKITLPLSEEGRPDWGTQDFNLFVLTS